MGYRSSCLKNLQNQIKSQHGVKSERDKDGQETQGSKEYEPQAPDWPPDSRGDTAAFNRCPWTQEGLTLGLPWILEGYGGTQRDMGAEFSLSPMRNSLHHFSGTCVPVCTMLPRAERAPESAGEARPSTVRPRSRAQLSGPWQPGSPLAHTLVSFSFAFEGLM